MKRSRKNVEPEFNESESEDELDYSSQEDQSDSGESEPEFIEDEFDSDLSEEVSEDEDFEEAETDVSEAEFDEDEKLPILTLKLSESLLKNASTLSNSAVKKLLATYSAVISSMASNQLKLTADAALKKKAKDHSSKLKFKYLKNENKRLLKGTAERYSDASKLPAKKFLVRDLDVYNTFVSKTADVMSEFIKKTDVLGSKDEVLAAAPLVRKFLSSSVVQLAFAFDDFDLTRSTLISVSSSHVVRWVCAFRQLSGQLVKVVSSLMCAHPQKLTRVNCFQFLSEFLRCVQNPKLMGVQLSPRAYLVGYSRLQDAERKELVNAHVALLLKRCYSSHIKAVMNGLTLRNFSLFKLSQNCIAELYLQAPHDSLYVHAFKSIRDLAFNVRSEWNSCNLARKGSRPDPKAKRRRLGELEAAEPKHAPSLLFTVCSWGFIESVNIWISVISRSDERMRALVYPLVTVINALIKIKISNKSYLPLVLHLLTALNQFSDGVNKFIPIGSFIFFVLDNLKSFKHNKPVKGELEKSEDFMIKLKLSNKNLYSSQIRNMLYKHVELVLVDHLGLVSLNPSFPEFTFPVKHYLKKYIRSMSVPNEFKSSVNALFKIMKESSDVITDKREELPPEPLDVLKVFAGSKIPMNEYRRDLLSRHQLLNREKLLSTLQVNSL